MPYNISILSGDIFISNSDALMLSIDGSRSSAKKIHKKLKENCRAHASTHYHPGVSENLHAEVVVFLLALSVGLYHDLYVPLSRFLSISTSESLLAFLEELTDQELIKSRDAVVAFLKQLLQKELLDLPTRMFSGHNKFVSRFTFEDLLN